MRKIFSLILAIVLLATPVFAGQQLVNLPLTSDLTDTKGNLTAGGLIRNSDATYTNTSGALAYSRGSRENLILHSDDLSHAYWGKDQFTVSGTSGLVASAVHGYHFISKGSLTSVGSTYILSLKAKAGAVSWVAIELGTTGLANFNIADGTAGSSTNCLAQVASAVDSEGFYRVSAVFTSTGGNWITIYIGESDVDFQFAGDGSTVSMYVKNLQLELIPSGNAVGSDTVTNGAFTTDASWTKGTDWLIDDADSNVASKTAGTASDLSQATAYPSGETVQVVFTMTRTAGALTPKIGAVAASAFAASGTYTVYIKSAAATPSLIFSADADFAGTLDTVSAKSVPDVAYLNPGIYSPTTESTATIPAEPRFETNGLLVEGEGTNFVTYSCDFTNVAWVKTNITPLKNQTGPDGVASSASLLTAGAANGTSLFTVADGGVAANKTFSVWLKRITGTGNIDITDNNGSNWTTQTITSSWAKYTLAARIQAIPIVGIRIVTSGDAIAVCLAQSEISALATSPIPTNGCPATRLTEAGSTTNGYLWTMSAAFKAAATAKGTLLVDVTPGHAAASGAGDGSGVISLTDAAKSFIYYDYTNTNFEGTDGTNTPENDETIASGTTYTVAVRWDQDANSGDGYFKVSEKHGGTWTHGTSVAFNDAYTAGDYLRLAYGNEFPMWIRNIKVYDGWVKDANLDHPKGVFGDNFLDEQIKVEAYQY